MCVSLHSGTKRHGNVRTHREIHIVCVCGRNGVRIKDGEAEMEPSQSDQNCYNNGRNERKERKGNNGNSKDCKDSGIG